MYEYEYENQTDENIESELTGHCRPGIVGIMHGLAHRTLQGLAPCAGAKYALKFSKVSTALSWNMTDLH